MPDPLDIFSGKSLERRVSRHRCIDPATGEECSVEEFLDTEHTFDGAVNAFKDAIHPLLPCGHTLMPGQPVARCDKCSKKAGHTVFVCEKCAVTCPMTGQSLCLRCTRPGPDGQRYSKKGYKRARKMGLFDPPEEVRPVASSGPVCTPSRGKSLLGRFLEWW